MRLFVYALIIALVIILFKAFYWDSRVQETPVEINTTEAAIQAEPELINPPKDESYEIKKEDNTTIYREKIPRYQQKEMPLDKLGNSIAEKIDL